MNKEWYRLNYKLVLAPMLISFGGLLLLFFAGSDGLQIAFALGLILFAFGVNQLMGVSVAGENAVMMNLLPVSAKTAVWTKVLICGTWVGVITSIPAYLMMRNGGAYVDRAFGHMAEYFPAERSIFYRGMPQYRYAIETNPSAMDVAVGDLMDGGAGVAQIGVMAALIPVILFLIGCYFGVAVLITQLYVHPLLKKYPTMVVSVLGLVVFGGVALGTLMLIKGAMEHGFLDLFAGELVTFGFFGGMTWFLSCTAVKRMKNGYDV